MPPKITYSYTTHYQQLPGNCNIAYIDEGSGDRTLLFIHGLANYALVWRKNIDYLRQYYRCIAIDLPGNGLSDQNEHPFSMRFFADSVADLIKALDLKKVTLVGHSMGGQIAMTTVLHHPTCADSLVLCAPAGFEVFTALDKTMYNSTLRLFDFISSDEMSLRSAIENSFYRHHKQGESVIAELTSLMKTYKLNYYRKMMEACVNGMMNEPVSDQFHLIKQRTLIQFGSHDALIPNKLIHNTSTNKLAKDAAAKFPNGKLKMIADAGHFVQWEKPEEVNRNIILFLEEDNISG